MHNFASMQFRLGVGMLLLFVPWIAEPAAPSMSLSDAEIGKLPDYCIAKIGALRGDPAQVKHFEEVIGRDKWAHLHHYCTGLGFVNRARLAFGAEKGNRALYLQRAGNDFRYVMDAWPKDFFMQADAHFAAGQASRLGGNDVKAMSFFTKAIDLRPDFAQAYAALADMWEYLGEKAKAREVLEQGLKNTGNDALLVRRMVQLEASGSSSPAPRIGAPVPGRTTNTQGAAKKP